MPEVLWPKAHYVDSNGVRRTIEAKRLNEVAVLAEARDNFLTDESEQVRLYPRTPEDVASHFYSKGPSGERVYSGDRDPKHDKRVTDLTRYLNLIKGPWSIWLRKSGVGSVERELPPYQWQAETTKVIGDRVLVRHDIYGQSPALADSFLRPAIAVEVINTHYPEEPAFQAMLEHSRRYPYIVYFDHVRRFNRFFEVDGHGAKVYYDQNSFVIKEGQLFKGEYPSGITSSALFKVTYERMLDDWDRYSSSSRASRDPSSTDSR